MRDYREPSLAGSPSPPRPDLDELRAETLAVRSTRGDCDSPMLLSARYCVSSTVRPAEFSVGKVIRG